MNRIQQENSNPGNPQTEWDIPNGGAGDPTIEGFATDMSVNAGETVFFKVSTDATAYQLKIYRMGYYDGSGARLIETVSPSVPLPQAQPEGLTDEDDEDTGLLDCGNWAISASWAVPSTAVSGIYFAKLVRSDTGGANHIIFVVRNDESHSDLVFQTSDLTWQAYNFYGGKSLYGAITDASDDLWNLDLRAYKASYNRPFNTRQYAKGSWVFYAEYPMVRWLEANGYDVTYISGVDTGRDDSLLLNHKVFLSVGHDEYWDGDQRANVEAARAAGVHLAFFSANEVFWKTRWEDSIDDSNTPYRTLVCYKETIEDEDIDPCDPPTWTGAWADPRFSPPGDGGRPANSLTGTLFKVTAEQVRSIVIPYEQSKLRFWRNTAVAALEPGQSYSTPAGTLGYEFDVDEDNGFRPAGLFPMSSNAVQITGDCLLDYGSTYGDGVATHCLTLYRHSSRSLVFGAGTVQWPWGLDNNHDTVDAMPNTDAAMQQATVNLFEDMGVQPATLQAGLRAATKSTDTSAPASTITSPANHASVSLNVSQTITVTATDSGGGVPAAVEVSVDGGTAWHPAVLSALNPAGSSLNGATWSYSWTPAAAGSYTIKSRAVDDSGNLEAALAGITVTVAATAVPAAPADLVAHTQ